MPDSLNAWYHTAPGTESGRQVTLPKASSSTALAGLLIGALGLAGVIDSALADDQAESDQTVTVEGATFARTLDAHGQRYSLIGTAVLTYLIWTPYAGAYYQAEGEPQPRPLSDLPRRLELAYFRGISAEDFVEATNKSLEKSLESEALEALGSSIEAINQSYRSVEEGDRYALSWDGEQLRLALNGEVIHTDDNAKAARAMFSIWLGSSPIDADFRDEVLGR